MILPEGMLCRSQYYKLIKKKNLICDDGERVDGLCCKTKHMMWIDPTGNIENEVETVFHEWVHGMWEEIGLGEEELPVMLEHMVVCAIAKDMIANSKEIMLILSQLPGMKIYLKSLLKIKG